jgi:hypothetical protein
MFQRNEFTINNLQSQLQRLKQALEIEPIKASEACARIVQFTQETPDPLANSRDNEGNPYSKKPKGRCLC